MNRSPSQPTLLNWIVAFSAILLLPALANLRPALADNNTSQVGAPVPGLPQRHYRTGETLIYQMQGSNRDASKMLTYQVEGRAEVKEDSAGRFFERYVWSNLAVNGHRVDAAGANFYQDVSLVPDFKLSVSNLSSVRPMLVGPITDLLTFYADTQLSMRQTQLSRAGDQVYVRHGKPNSWADGTRVILGQDAIDFNIALEKLDASSGTATVLVRHVPPKMPQIELPAGWMREPVVAGVANNWVEVSKSGQGYIASVGEEEFDVRITLSLADGKILSAAMENPVEVKERKCLDAAFANCSASKRYQIMRKVRLDLEP